MKIPLPCKFGELSDCDGKLLPLCGVHWFDWMSGRQYTYFFETGDQWHPYTFYETRQEQQPFSMEIPDDLLSDGLIKEKGYPLRGAGKVLGVDYRDGTGTTFPAAILFSRPVGILRSEESMLY